MSVIETDFCCQKKTNLLFNFSFLCQRLQDARGQARRLAGASGAVWGAPVCFQYGPFLFGPVTWALLEQSVGQVHPKSGVFMVTL